MSTERRAAIINDIHELQKGTPTEAALKIAVSKLLILQRAETSKHEDEAFQLYSLIDELADKLSDQEQVSTEQSRVIASLELVTNQKASEVLLLQKEVVHLKDMHKKDLVARGKFIHSLSERNSILLDAIKILESRVDRLPKKKGHSKDYKAFAVSTGTLLSETMQNYTQKDN